MNFTVAKRPQPALLPLSFHGKPAIFNFNTTMSQHPSFTKGASAALKKRSVLKRFERVNILKKRGQWSDGDRVTGLRKTRPEE